MGFFVDIVGRVRSMVNERETEENPFKPPAQPLYSPTDPPVAIKVFFPAAGITKLDFVLITHYHQDHGGGAAQLAARIPIGTFIDHGENREHNDPPTEQVWRDYQVLLAKENRKRMIVKPGEVLPLLGM